MKSGFVAIVGRANAGKSTLINLLVGEKIAIVSPKPQTTRDNTVGIVNEQDVQAVFIDTPGIHQSKSALDSYMTQCVSTASEDASLVLYCIDSSKGILMRDIDQLNEYHARGTKLMIVLTKIDLVEKQMLLPLLQRLNQLDFIEAVFPISCFKKQNTTELLGEIKKYLTDSVAYYPQDMVTDKSETHMIAEIIREGMLYRYNKEIPHGVGVYIQQFSYDEHKQIFDIYADIICEKSAHKTIIIGKQGEALKSVATAARQRLQDYLGGQVYLNLWVRIKEDWRNRAAMLKELGYDTAEKGGSK